MKRKFLYVLFVVSVLGVVGCANRKEEVLPKSATSLPESTTTLPESTTTETIADTVDTGKMFIAIGDTVLTATLENNESVDALRLLLADGSLTINFSQYGGFEQVGSIGNSLPTNDIQTKASAGDIVLYSGNQMVMFYGNHSWAYTRLGKIDDVSASDLESILGNGDITATFSLEE